MNKKIENIFSQIQEVSGYLWQNGWAERNGGNISVNITEEYGNTATDIDQCAYVEYQQLNTELAGKIFFSSGTGLRIRDMVKNLTSLKRNSCLLKINEKANGYHIIWGGEREGFRPTSELISHLNLHLDLIKRNTDYKAVIHTHPYELVSLTHSKEYCRSSEQISKNLWKMIPEVRLFVPKGIGLVPYALPSSEKLADLTVETLRKYNVALWEKHGAVAVGENVIEAFDFIDVANKGAKIFLQCLSAGYIPEGISNAQLKELEKAFNL